MDKLNFKVFGDGEPLVIMHGLYGSSDNWVTIARELMHKYKVYLLDMRNHGLSPHLDEHNYSVMTDDLLHFLNDMHIYSANIMGHSMGGKVAMSFVSLYPERVKKLIIVDISPREYSSSAGDKQFDEHSMIINSLRSIDLKSLGSRKEAEIILAKKIKSEGVRMFLLKNLTRTKDKEFYWKINLPVLQDSLVNIVVGLEDEFDNLSAYRNAALFIKGGDSSYIKAKDIELINSLFEQVEVHTIQGASHWVHAEKKNEFLTLVQDFLAN